VSPSFELEAPDFFSAGAVGRPGQRVFYLQAAEGRTLVTLKVEKEQLEALAEYLASLLAKRPTAAPEPEDPPGDLALREPIAPAWAAGTIAVAQEEAPERIVIVAEEREDDEAEADAATARFRITRSQARAFVERARELVMAGRPSCRLCGRPIDPDGHVCPRANGHGHTPSPR